MSSLTEGFRGWWNPDEDERREVLRSGIIVLDTNVLLDLYKLGAGPRQNLVDVLQELQGRLFVPHQAALEFWRNRVTVLEDVGKSAPSVAMEKARSVADDALRQWQARTRVGAVAEQLRADLRRTLDDVEQRMHEVDQPLDVPAAVADVALDPVVQALVPLLEGAVGPAPAPARLAELIATGRRRFADQVPPGYLDAGKDAQAEGGTGDYLLWEQVLEHAEAQGRDVLLVTRDSKADWWRSARNGRLLGPRAELVEEFAARTTRRLHLALPSDLLDLAQRHLGVAVSEATRRDVERVVDEQENEQLWDVATARALLTRLNGAGYEVQAAIVEEAARRGGEVSRERVLELAGLPEDAKLGSLMKPVVTVQGWLVAEGELPAGLEYPLWAEYGNGSGRLTGYSVAESLTAALTGSRTHDV